MEFDLSKEKYKSRRKWIDRGKWCDQRVGELADYRGNRGGDLGTQSREIGGGEEEHRNEGQNDDRLQKRPGPW